MFAQDLKNDLMLAHGAEVFHAHILGHGVELGDILLLQVANIDGLAICFLERGEVLAVFLHVSGQPVGHVAAAAFASATAFLRAAFGIFRCRFGHCFRG